MRDNKDLRIFFALWPDAVMRKQLANASNSIPVERPARRVPDYNLHLTLCFIGNVYRDQLVCMQQQARLIEAKGFEFDIDCQGHFSKPRVAWLGCREIPDALQDLHHQLGQGLRHCDYQPESRRYHPHITVARKIKSIPACSNFEPMRWRVDKFGLIESRSIESGVEYQVIDSYDLT
jgi:2'-5' RNA ligase